MYFKYFFNIFLNFKINGKNIIEKQHNKILTKKSKFVFHIRVLLFLFFSPFNIFIMIKHLSHHQYYHNHYKDTIMI